MTERAKKLLLLYYKQSRKIRRVSGLPPLTFKAKKAGTLKNYRIYGQTVDGESVGDRTGNLFDKTRNTIPDAILDAGAIYAGDGYLIYAPINPLQTYTFRTNGTIRINLRSAFTINEPAVSVSYVIDGVNTHINHNANKEFTRRAPLNANWIVIQIRDESALAYDNMLNLGSTALPYEPYGYKVPVTVEGKNLCNNIWEQKAINADSGNAIPNENTVCCDFIPVKPNVTYSCSRTIWNNYNNLRCYGTNKNYLGTGTVLANKANPLPQGASFGTFMITDARVSYIRFNDLSNSLDTKYMLVEGVYTAETMPPYEPVTTNLYLPEPIKMVGDEAEYIDYAEQKMHRIGADDIDVTLPALPTLSGTNTLTVGTEVQPSSVEIKGRIKAAGGD